MKTYYPHFTEKGMTIQIHKAQNSERDLRSVIQSEIVFPHQILTKVFLSISFCVLYLNRSCFSLTLILLKGIICTMSYELKETIQTLGPQFSHMLNEMIDPVPMQITSSSYIPCVFVRVWLKTASQKHKYTRYIGMPGELACCPPNTVSSPVPVSRLSNGDH